MPAESNDVLRTIVRFPTSHVSFINAFILLTSFGEVAILERVPALFLSRWSRRTVIAGRLSSGV
jgi:hypothetical protein